MEKIVSIPADLLERAREIPGAVKKARKASYACRQARSVLQEVLSALSDEALAYVWRPIVYAYLWTDAHGHDLMTDDDMRRIGLYGMIANGSPEAVERLDKWRLTIERSMGKKAHDVERKR